MIYPSPYFALRLNEEMLRSDRTGKPFSLVVIPAEKLNGSGGNGAGLSQVLDKFVNNTRLCDSLGWFPDGRLGLVLPDTGEIGAQNVVARFKNHFTGLKKSEAKYPELENDLFSIKEYPGTARNNMSWEMEDACSHQGNCEHLRPHLHRCPNCYPKRYYRTRVKEEIVRTCRTGSYFLLVLFDPSRLISGGHRDPRVIETWVNLVDEETDGYGVKGWWDNKRIGILVHNTTSDAISSSIGRFITRLKALDYRIAQPSERQAFQVLSFQEMNRNSRNDDDQGKGVGLGGKGLNDDGHTVANGDLSILHNLAPHQETVKRVFDLLASSFLMVCLSPLFLICAIMIKIDSPGPVFYKQTRIGKGGRPFTFLKFRSMRYGADEKVHEEHVRNLMNGKAGLATTGSSTEKSYKLVKDERVSRFGKWLRKYSIDELPQLINVLKGDMSLVGPRPHPVYEAELYNLWQSYRLNIKPGITGLGQVYGRSNKTYEDVYRLDVQYFKTASLILDLKILFRTVFVVFSNRGAY